MNRKKIKFGLPLVKIDEDPMNLACKKYNMVIRKIYENRFSSGSPLEDE